MLIALPPYLCQSLFHSLFVLENRPGVIILFAVFHAKQNIFRSFKILYRRDKWDRFFFLLLLWFFIIELRWLNIWHRFSVPKRISKFNTYLFIIKKKIEQQSTVDKLHLWHLVNNFYSIHFPKGKLFILLQNWRLPTWGPLFSYP